MHAATVRTVSRAALRAPVTKSMGINYARRMTTATSPEFPDIRDSAVRDSIMDKLWEKATTIPNPTAPSSAAPAEATATSTVETTAQPAASL